MLEYASKELGTTMWCATMSESKHVYSCSECPQSKVEQKIFNHSEGRGVVNRNNESPVCLHNLYEVTNGNNCKPFTSLVNLESYEFCQFKPLSYPGCYQMIWKALCLMNTEALRDELLHSGLTTTKRECFVSDIRVQAVETVFQVQSG